MAATQGIYLFIFTCFRLITIVLCRGANDLADGETITTTWPIPRAPQTANSSYIRTVPATLLQNPYPDVTVPYLSFYRSYWRGAVPGGYKATNFTPTTEVCVNYQSFSNRSIGVFRCPFSPFEPREYTACCGVEYVEYCCLSKHYLDDIAFNQSMGGALFFTLVVLVLLFGAIVWSVAAFKTSILNFLKRRKEEVELKKKIHAIV